MSKNELIEFIQSKFQKQSHFIRKFNNYVGKTILDKSILSAQLSGKRELSNGWIAAYTMFSNFLNQAYQTSMLNQQNYIQQDTNIMIEESEFTNEKYQMVFNYQIHEVAKMDISDFLERIECITALRARWRRTFSFYPTSKHEYDENINLWRYVNGQRNALNNHHLVYAVAIPKSIYYFLRHTKRSQIFKPVLLGLATLWVLEPEKRSIMERQLYGTFYEKAVKLAKKYFHAILNDVPKADIEDVHYGHLYWQRYRDALDDAIRDYVGNTTLVPFIDASGEGAAKRYEMALLEKNEFDIGCPYAYMTDSDWKNIVINGNDDDLMRVESDRQVIDLWKNDLGHYHKGLDILV